MLLHDSRAPHFNRPPARSFRPAVAPILLHSLLSARPRRLPRKPYLREFPDLFGSVDSGALMSRLSSFRINTSKKSRQSRIALIANDFKSTRINTSVIFRFNSSRINTSKKTGRGGIAHIFNLREISSARPRMPRGAQVSFSRRDVIQPMRCKRNCQCVTHFPEGEL